VDGTDDHAAHPQRARTSQTGVTIRNLRRRQGVHVEVPDDSPTGELLDSAMERGKAEEMRALAPDPQCALWASSSTPAACAISL
jgi:hypothetical protein